MKPGSVKNIFLLVVVLLLQSGLSYAQAGIPEKPDPPRLVNDFAKILTTEQVQNLESKLVAFSDSTSVQIAIVIVPTLDGYEKADYAQQLGQKWGVGGSKFNNGFVVLIKPKSASENGEAFIATGYGVEQFVPDATSYEIVNNEMIPHFKQNDYYGGIDAATNVIMSLVKGEYKADSYGKHKKDTPIGFIIILIIFIIIFLISRNNNNNNGRTINRSGTGGMLLFPWIMGGGGNSGGFGGGGFGGGGGGGFGGFGGGGFGGGGAGGSW